MSDQASNARAVMLHRRSSKDRDARPLRSPWAVVRAQRHILIAVLAAVAFTIVSRTLSITVQSLSGHTMVDTVAGLIGALAAFVFVERLPSTRQLRDLLMALSLGIFGVTDLVLAAGPTLIDVTPGNSWRWIILAGRLIAGIVLIAAAFCPPSDLDRFPSRSAAIVTATIGALVATIAALLVWHAHLPSLLESASASAAAHIPPLWSYLQLAAAILAATAAFGLARRSTRSGDGLERSIAAGIAVLAIARFNYFLISSMSEERLYAGDILKLGAFLLILYGCLIEYRALQRKLAERVAVGERRRMARDMHDGLAQELAFIASHSQRLSHSGEDATTVAHLQSAAERALHDSRTTIAVLTAPQDIPLEELILSTADSFRSRFAVDVELELDHRVHAAPETRTALLRILHEALTNAVRHGSAGLISVSLTRDSESGRLRIADDGNGFDVTAALSAGKGLGLTSMQERAEMLGGALSISSTPQAGTVVEVVLP
jgi:signal transduction histidine kinase